MQDDRLFTVEQVAEKLSMTVWTIRSWLRTRKLVGSKTGNEWRIAEKDLNAFLQATKNATS